MRTSVCISFCVAILSQVILIAIKSLYTAITFFTKQNIMGISMNPYQDFIGYRNTSDPDIIGQNATIAIANTAPIIAIFVIGNNDTVLDSLVRGLEDLRRTHS